MAKNEFLTKKGMDATSAIANRERLYIDINQATIGKSVRFKAILTKFNDQYDTVLESENMMGSVEEVKNYTHINRKIDFSWDAVASNFSEAKDNMARASAMFQMLYPIRAPSSTGIEIVPADGYPIFRLRILNLVGEAGIKLSGAAASGLVGFLDNLSYNIDMDSGFFQKSGQVFPQLVKFDATFWPQHPTTPPAWVTSDTDSSGIQFNVPGFPYGIEPKWSHEVKGITIDDVAAADEYNFRPGTGNSRVMGELDQSRKNKLTGR